ncbi:unnamed protein product [Trichobilharzia regenti]|nr:unnamed protein product [Trichobilharzia regenti]
MKQQMNETMSLTVDWSRELSTYGLKDIENNEWRDVVNLQRGWLGNLNGTQIEFDVISSDERQRVDPRQHQMLYSPATDGHSIRSKKTKDRLVVFTKYPSLAVADLISYIRVGSDSVYFADMYRKVGRLLMHSLCYFVLDKGWFAGI